VDLTGASARAAQPPPLAQAADSANAAILAQLQRMQQSMDARDAAGDARTTAIEHRLAALALQPALQPAALPPALQPAALQLAAARPSSATALHCAPAHMSALKLSAYSNTGNGASDDELFCDDYGCTGANGHAARNSFITGGARNVSMIGKEGLELLKPRGGKAQLVTPDGQKLSFETAESESADKLGTAAQYMRWLRLLEVHIEACTYANKVRRLRTVQYISYYFNQCVFISLLKGQAFMLAAGLFFPKHTFGNNLETDRLLLGGGASSLSCSSIYPTLQAQADVLQTSMPALAAGAAALAASAAALAANGDKDKARAQWSAVYCYYCGSKEHNMDDHVGPITKPCPQCSHMYGKSGPLKSNCKEPGCSCKCFTDQEEAAKRGGGRGGGRK
jgi:hypothetical protein